MIRAIYRDGVIQPLDDVPAHWLEGEELTVEPTGGKMSPEELGEIDAWVADVEAAAAKIPESDHERFMAAIAEADAQAKGRSLTPDDPLIDLEERLRELHALGPMEFEPGEREQIDQALASLNQLGLVKMQQLADRLP